MSLKGGKYFISIQTRREVEAPIHPSTSVVGIDVGIARFATFSDGSFIPPINRLKKHEERLKRYQRMVARRTKYGQNWKKAKAKVTRIQIRIANTRTDFLHKESTKISKNHAVVIVEDLKVKNMSASAKGTIEFPGRNVKAKSGLNRAILAQGWGEFRRMLAYKLEWRGGNAHCGPAAAHQPGMPGMPSRVGGQPAYTGPVRLRRVRVREQRRCRRQSIFWSGDIRLSAWKRLRVPVARRSRNLPKLLGWPMPESRRNPRVTPWEDVNRHIYSALIDLPAHDLETRQALEAMLTDHHIHFRTTPKQPCKRRYSVPTVDLCCARSVLLALEYQESGAGGGA